jgi:hypothetical protein
MAEAKAQEPVEQPGEDLDQTIPLETLEHLLQDGDAPASDIDRDLVVTELQRLVRISESIEQRLEQIVELLSQKTSAPTP